MLKRYSFRGKGKRGAAGNEILHFELTGIGVRISCLRILLWIHLSMCSGNIARWVNNIHTGDCLDVLKEIPDESIDMILCDLPYGTTQNKWDNVIDLTRLWAQYERIIKPVGAIVLNSQGIFTAKLMLSNEKLFKYKLTWVKSKSTNFLNVKKQPLRKHEDICVFYKKQPTYHPQMLNGEPYIRGIRKNQLTGSYGNFGSVFIASTNGQRYPSDVIYFKTAESEGSVWHPTQKPVELGRYLVRTFTNPGDIVLDSTCGSGSYMVAAVLEGRNFIGIEKNKATELFKKFNIDYVALSKKRIEETVKGLSEEIILQLFKLNLLADREGFQSNP